MIRIPIAAPKMDPTTPTAALCSAAPTVELNATTAHANKYPWGFDKEPGQSAAGASHPVAHLKLPSSETLLTTICRFNKARSVRCTRDADHQTQKLHVPTGGVLQGGMQVAWENGHM